MTDFSERHYGEQNKEILRQTIKEIMVGALQRGMSRRSIADQSLGILALVILKIPERPEILSAFTSIIDSKQKAHKNLYDELFAKHDKERGKQHKRTIRLAKDMVHRRKLPKDGGEI